jgi:4-alpha-glucanotransferase
MRLPRSSGVLLHPTSLPGPFGIGDLGRSAHEFAAILGEAGQRWWQMLPVGPTGYGNSPYQSYSSFAGNPLLISPELLSADGLLSVEDLEGLPKLPEGEVDFEAVVPVKEKLLRKAFENSRPGLPGNDEFAVANRHWLEDYTLFLALKDVHGGAPWYEWPLPLVRREPDALSSWRERLAPEIGYHLFVQYVFARQWSSLREECRRRQIGLIGDLPIFVAQDSTDVWARPDLFLLDAEGRPTVVAGVPPDYFAATGQLWGNPLYRWPAHQAEGFAWWIARLRAQLERVDLVRLDHFRGFEAYWEIPAGSPTAEHGRWVHAPGREFLTAVRAALGGLPLIAEDLGDITREVEQLRDQFLLPGMRVLQFGYSGAPGTEFHAPFTFVNHCIAYTGTHDNDTTVGWFTAPVHADGSAEERSHTGAQRTFALRLLGSNGEEVHWDAIRAVMASVADTAIFPLQDVLGLGTAARMNVPGVVGDNWTWRYRAGQLRLLCRARLAELTAVYGRWNGATPRPFGPPAPPEITGSTPAPSS